MYSPIPMLHLFGTVVLITFNVNSIYIRNYWRPYLYGYRDPNWNEDKEEYWSKYRLYNGTYSDKYGCPRFDSYKYSEWERPLDGSDRRYPYEEQYKPADNNLYSDKFSFLRNLSKQYLFADGIEHKYPDWNKFVNTYQQIRNYSENDTYLHQWDNYWSYYWNIDRDKYWYYAKHAHMYKDPYWNHFMNTKWDNFWNYYFWRRNETTTMYDDDERKKLTNYIYWRTKPWLTTCREWFTETTTYDDTKYRWYYIVSKAKECNCPLALDVDDFKTFCPGVKVIANPWDKGKLSQQWRWVAPDMIKNRLTGLHIRVNGSTAKNLVLANGNPLDTYQRFFLMRNDSHIHFTRDNGQIQVFDIKLQNATQNYTIRNDVILHNIKKEGYKENQEFDFIRAF